MKIMFFFQLKEVAWHKAIITKQRDGQDEVNALTSIEGEEFNEKSVMSLEVLLSPAQIY